MPPDLPVTVDDVRRAAARLAGQVVRTPSARSRTLSEITGADVVVKFENLQFTASFKERGALNRLLALPAGTSGVVAASAGNFAQGVAHHASRLGIPATIVMPETTPLLKVARTTALGATVLLRGTDFDASAAAAASLAASEGHVLLSPFDDPEVIAGQGTVALELLEDVPDVEVLVAPVGGGGLLAGMAVAARAVAPAVEIVGVQSERYPSVHDALTGERHEVGGSTIAEGIAVRTPGVRTVALIRALADRVELVDEAVIERAVGLYLEVEKVVAEGAGAAPLAELLARPERYAGRTVGLVLSGGNIDLRQLASVVLRGLVRSGRLTTFWVEVPDRPGTLGAVTTLLGEVGANVVEVQHQRLNLAVHARATDVQLTVETADADHARRVLDALTAAGFAVRTTDEIHRLWHTSS